MEDKLEVIHYIDFTCWFHHNTKKFVNDVQIYTECRFNKINLFNYPSEKPGTGSDPYRIRVIYFPTNITAAPNDANYAGYFNEKPADKVIAGIEKPNNECILKFLPLFTSSFKSLEDKFKGYEKCRFCSIIPYAGSKTNDIIIKELRDRLSITYTCKNEKCTDSSKGLIKEFTSLDKFTEYSGKNSERVNSKTYKEIASRLKAFGAQCEKCKKHKNEWNKRCVNGKYYCQLCPCPNCVCIWDSFIDKGIKAKVECKKCTLKEYILIDRKLDYSSGSKFSKAYAANCTNENCGSVENGTNMWKNEEGKCQKCVMPQHECKYGAPKTCEETEKGLKLTFEKCLALDTCNKREYEFDNLEELKKCHFTHSNDNNNEENKLKAFIDKCTSCAKVNVWKDIRGCCVECHECEFSEYSAKECEGGLDIQMSKCFTLNKCMKVKNQVAISVGAIDDMVISEPKLTEFKKKIEFYNAECADCKKYAKDWANKKLINGKILCAECSQPPQAKDHVCKFEDWKWKKNPNGITVTFGKCLADSTCTKKEAVIKSKDDIKLLNLDELYPVWNLFTNACSICKDDKTKNSWKKEKTIKGTDICEECKEKGDNNLLIATYDLNPEESTVPLNECPKCKRQEIIGKDYNMCFRCLSS